MPIHKYIILFFLSGYSMKLDLIIQFNFSLLSNRKEEHDR